MSASKKMAFFTPSPCRLQTCNFVNVNPSSGLPSRDRRAVSCESSVSTVLNSHNVDNLLSEDGLGLEVTMHIIRLSVNRLKECPNTTAPTTYESVRTMVTYAKEVDASGIVRHGELFLKWFRRDQKPAMDSQMKLV